MKIKGYASTNDRDRGGDIVASEAWTSGLENYKKNPVVLFQHNANNPIGKITSLTADNKGLLVEAEISSTEPTLTKKMEEGILSAFSIGFIPNEASYNEEMDTFIIKSLELLEISVVSVPMNQNTIFSVVKE